MARAGLSGLVRKFRGLQKLKSRADYLVETIKQSDEVRELVESPGWNTVEQVLEHYRALALREFRDGKRTDDRYRADLDALDSIEGSLTRLLEMGDEAKKELAQIKPELERRAARMRSTRSA